VEGGSPTFQTRSWPWNGFNKFFGCSNTVIDVISYSHQEELTCVTRTASFLQQGILSIS
jgi:hypothetical protein